MVVVPNQVSVGFAGANLLQRPLLAHLKNPRRSDENFAVRSAECGVPELMDRFAIFLWVFELAIESLNARTEGGIKLFEITDKDN